MKNTQAKIGKALVVKVDNSLDKYADKPFVKRKLDAANKILQRVGIPPDLRK